MSRAPARPKATRLTGYERAWQLSRPAREAPLGLAPDEVFLRRLKVAHPSVEVRWATDRGVFVLWEKTRRGHMAVIQDIPPAHPFDQRLIDHLTSCSLAAQGGLDKIIEGVDEADDKIKADEIAAARKREPDPERLLWAAQKDFRDILSTPLGIHVSVPQGLPTPKDAA